MSYVQVQFAIDDPEIADSIVESLLSEHLVACGQRSAPMISRYWWKGRLERAEEWLVLLKTRTDLAPRVIEVIVGAHPYQTPEVIAVAIVDGARHYLEWIDDVTAVASRK
ncbi:MAG TPA: divalent-cation tolerance protein CutA [Acidimicrobiales bacterium]|jgi:periplasmic divalent cation tolerance protein|nr:divalent-cation tolerance protein CutA [Acidimicrobiales bacterium]